jgi:hypothetical protein
MQWLVDKEYRVPRIWSNKELKKFSQLFLGDVLNVSGWQDKDKEGGFYKDYFRNAASYTISNFRADTEGLQGYPNEFFLDLTKPLPDPALVGKYDVAFNHTTLEHVYEFHTAFNNICALSRDIVIIVVPWLQPMHTNYGDYWRFSPQAIEKMFAANGFTVLYSSFNTEPRSSVYVFAIASRHPEKWQDTIHQRTSTPATTRLTAGDNQAGYRAISNSYLFRLLSPALLWLRKTSPIHRIKQLLP